MLRTIYSTVILAALTTCALALRPLPACAAPPVAFVLSAKSHVSIALPQNATLPEKVAALELDGYLTRATGGDFTVVVEAEKISSPTIYVGNTAFAKAAGVNGRALVSEAWRIKAQNGNLILVGGGTRGTLYATYHFLEDVVGVHWWNPWEETVPNLRELPIHPMDVRGQPSFSYRDIFMIYGYDEGRFAIRNRLDRQGDAPIAAKYGASRDYGPPYHVHTFYKSVYIDPAKYYATHPDWFVGNGGAMPTIRNSQLAMSNPEMRKEFLRLLLENIRESRVAAIANHLPPPDVYDVSQNDNPGSFVDGPSDVALVKANGGAESAILLDFINYLADGIKTEFPNVSIETLAYLNGEQAPTHMTARDNVIIRLADTQSNQLLPVTATRNHVMRENIENWAKDCKNLWVWDYDITYGFPHVPQPTSQTYAPDLQFFRAHNVKGMFIEFEEPLRADMRDMKIWVLCKLLEDPNQNYDALVKTFTDGYYGAAGPYVRQYLATLHTAAIESGADINWLQGIDLFSYLTTDFLKQADGIYAKAAEAVKNDPVLSYRVAWARASVDIAILRRFPTLMKQWRQDGHATSTFPLDRGAAGNRYLKAMDSRIDMWMPNDQQQAEYLNVQATVDNLISAPAYLPLPTKFKDVPVKDLFTYSAGDTRNAYNKAKVVVDKGAESGYATRFEIPDDELAKYKLPMQWGIYDTVGKKNILFNLIKAADISGAGYHWYKLGDAVLTDRDFLFFFWSWIIQNDLVSSYNAATPNAKYEVWADIKFEGPAFPFAKVGDKNAISVERIVIIKK